MTAANDLHADQPIPAASCGNCEYWCPSLHARTTFGVCTVRPGGFGAATYTRGDRHCDVNEGRAFKLLKVTG